MEKKIVAGIIGLEFGRAHLEGALAYGAEIGLICDCDEKSLKFAADKYNIPEEKCTLDYHDIINNKEINAVSIGIPDQLHKQVAIEMLEAGKHVLCEKPLALTKEDVAEIVETHLKGGQLVERLLYDIPGQNKKAPDMSHIPFFQKQKRVALRNCGTIDPENLGEAIAHGAYQGLGKALTEMTPADAIAEVEKSGIRGRGGAGRPEGPG